MGNRPGIFSDSGLNHFVVLPVDEPFVVIMDQYRPLGLGEAFDPFFKPSGLIHKGFLFGFTIGVHPCIDRIGQDGMNSVITGRYPFYLRQGICL